MVPGGGRAALQRDRAELGVRLAVLGRDVRDIADGEHAREPGDREIAADVDPAAPALRQPAGAGDRRGHQAAAPDHAAGLDRAPVGQGHVAGTDGLDADPQAQLDAVLLEDPRRVGVALVEEHLEELRAVVDEVDLRARRQRRELVDHRRVDHLGQGAGDLDPGRTAADDDEVDGALVDEARVAVGLLEGLDDARLQAVRVVERIERERVLRPGRTEEVRLGAGGEDEVVAGVRLAAVRRHAPGHRIDGHDLGALGIEVVEFGRDLAQRVGDVAGGQHRGRDLVQERLELVVVVLVDERDVQVLARGELPGTGDAGEPAADDDDACPRGGRRHAWSEKRGAAARRPTRVGGAESRTSVRRLTRRMVVASVTSATAARRSASKSVSSRHGNESRWLGLRASSAMARMTSSSRSRA